ncbi:DUF3017 domain-containing protein [Amycolatopsis cynarae]|uniref:DUF3017 domain-containing protein n=2 Tax=Amycolatopsis TaxID=1813 RepID=A0A558AH19_9PSEU|nr:MULTISPECIES: DUF3017 domain-containing protein [Amycolatopsis]TVT23568.1 DUF3017 domain-containing protein [Amycolatopsis rhizosphaerae]WAL65048.1 DUF3017 domain-containing protein [Amycolatopsis sp. HUAS 11-8]
MSWLRGNRAALVEQVPFGIVLALVAVAALRIWQYHWRQGAVIVGGALLVAAVFRAVLPGARAGLLAVRGRPVDVLSYSGLGAVLLFLAFTITDGPFGS